MVFFFIKLNINELEALIFKVFNVEKTFTENHWQTYTYKLIYKYREYVRTSLMEGEMY